MSDYISKSELLDSLIHCDGLGRKSLEAVVKTINEQPTLDEKEIIRKAFERVLQRLEQQEKQYNERAKKFAEALHSWEERRNYGKACSYAHAIEILKEECGINE